MSIYTYTYIPSTASPTIPSIGLPHLIRYTFSGNSISEANRPDQNPPVVNQDEAKHQLDPLLDLVIASESPESQHDTLLKIAEEARIVSEGKAIAAATSVAALDPQILATLGLGVVPPIENNQETRTKEFFDESSDDICGSKLSTIYI